VHGPASFWQIATGLGARPERQQVLAAAKTEGRIVVSALPQPARPFMEGFRRDTGIEVETPGGEARTTANRVVHEPRAGNVTILKQVLGAIGG
jgi:hypothetical protein